MPDRQQDTPIFVTNEDLYRKLGEVETKIDELKPLMQAWNAAVGGSRFIKWLAGLVAAVITAYLAIKNLLH